KKKKKKKKKKKRIVKFIFFFFISNELLSLILFVGLQKNYPFAVFEMALTILESCANENHEWDKMEYRITFSLAYILLTLPHGLIHKSSLNFLNKFVQLKCNFNTEQVIQEMIPTLQFEFQTAGIGIAETLKNSLVREELFDVCVYVVLYMHATGQFLDRMTAILAKGLNPHENEMFHLTVLAHFIKLQLRALAQKAMNCQHLVAILKSYEDKCQPMIRVCQVVAQHTTSDDFFVALFREYFRVFGSEDRFTLVTQTLCQFLEYGSPQWHNGILRLIDIVISVSTHDISPQLFKQ
ncbi:hypothetical protein RFI_18788, partial [Reticulomyxa filosa]